MGVYECVFSIICYRLPYNEFEIGVLNHLLIAPSKLYPLRYAFSKVFHQWCEYKGGNLTMMFFSISSRFKRTTIMQTIMVFSLHATYMIF